jgi:hypothetical protein
MRIVVRGAGAVVALVVTLVASGCATSSPRPSPTPTPSVTPLFESDDEALAAAEEAYAAYQQVLDAILIDGGANPDRLLTVATQEQYEYEKPGFDEALANGFHSTGGSTFDSMRVQHLGTPENEPALSVYVCDDYSTVDILDAGGRSIVPASRPDRFPRIVSFETTGVATPRVKVSTIEEWTGDPFC